MVVSNHWTGLLPTGLLNLTDGLHCSMNIWTEFVHITWPLAKNQKRSHVCASKHTYTFPAITLMLLWCGSDTLAITGSHVAGAVHSAVVYLLCLLYASIFFYAQLSLLCTRLCQLTVHTNSAHKTTSKSESRNQTETKPEIAGPEWAHSVRRNSFLTVCRFVLCVIVLYSVFMATGGENGETSPFFELGEIRLAKESDFQHFTRLVDNNEGWTQKLNKNGLVVWSKETANSSIKMMKV